MFRPCSLFSLSSVFSGKGKRKTHSSFFLFTATVSCIADRIFTVWATREAPMLLICGQFSVLVLLDVPPAFAVVAHSLFLDILSSSLASGTCHSLGFSPTSCFLCWFKDDMVYVKPLSWVLLSSNFSPFHKHSNHYCEVKCHFSQMNL